MPSKPNLIGFKVSIGIFGNKKISDATMILKRQIPEWNAAYTLCAFEMLMGYAAENQVDGDFSGYTADNYHRLVFLPKWVGMDIPIALNLKRTEHIVNAFAKVKLTEGNKIRSWKLFNKTIADHAKASKRNQENARIGQAKRHAKNKHDLKSIQNGKPLTTREEYLGTDEDRADVDTRTSTATAKRSEPEDKRTVEWNGKRWFISDLRGEVRRIEQQITEHKKIKPSTSELDSHNVWLTEANKLEKTFASALSALQCREIAPKVHKAPKPAAKFPFQPFEPAPEDKEKAESARKEFAALAEKL